MNSSIVWLITCLVLRSCKGTGQEATTIKETIETSSIVMLDSTIQIAKANAYNAKNVHWDTLSKEMFAMSAQHDSIDKIGKPTEYMFEMLGDFHGMLMYDYKVAYSYQPEDDGASRDSLWRSITTSKIVLPYEVVGKILENTNIAYVEIVGTGGMQNEDIALARDTIRSIICSLKTKDPDGWILDLIPI